MSTDSGLTPRSGLRAPVVTPATELTEAAPVVRFDRPLVEDPAWANPRVSRHVAEAARKAHERGHEQGLAAGYAAGWAQGRQAAAVRERQEVAERAEREEAGRRQLVGRVQALMASLAHTGRTMVEEAVPAWDELADLLVDGALRIARTSLHRELATVDAEVLEAVRTALRVLPVGEVVSVHLNPADAGLIGLDPTGRVLPDTSPGALPEGLQIVMDPAVEPGTVLARSPLQSLALDLKAGLRAAQEVLQP